MEDSLLRVLKKLLLVIIGSGLLSNALYIHGLAYYEGYINRLGFEYDFFPLPSTEVLFWTYYASRELGASSIEVITNFKLQILLILFGSVYLLSRIWVETSKKKVNNQLKARKKNNIKLFKKIYHYKVKHKLIFYSVYIPIRWLILKEQSLIAFFASYFFLVFLLFLPIFLFIWVYFPMIGFEHGKSVAESRIEHYKSNLCGDKNDYWSECLTFKMQHLKSYGSPKHVVGRLMLKNGSLVGVFTKEGPVTFTLPNDYYSATKMNINFEGSQKD
ncbi:hypothetical protein [Pseudoalteromonas sp. SWXJZ10B]|uniref:hypothetical protein n=1 Tax=Pseudoalteromonas sp. SWXJZ10B TaxID=2792063 RepID=UPI0018CCFBEA|nr:hypothetical protein [Pseudoalteromonas sp. SWXJZ10B]MBH0043319.1 hypothetical protein [Pseudoalteromonas sp. SWXJZ10B]